MKSRLLRKRLSIEQMVSFALSVSLSICPGSAKQISTTNTSALRKFDKASLQAVIFAEAKKLCVPGAVVLLRTPDGQFTVNYGTTELGAHTTPDAQTHFRIASNTKTMTAALIMLLAQKQKLALEDPISKYVSGVPNGDKITIANLLEMRSGLYNYTDSPKISDCIDREPTKVWSPKELLALSFAHQISAPAGEKFEYDNTNYALLGLVIEKVDGRSLEKAMHDYLFAPLKMVDTQLPGAESNVISKPYSHGYLFGSSSVALVGTPPYAPELEASARAGKILPKDYTNVNHSFAAAAGGVTSTAADLTKWIEALGTGVIFNPEYRRRWLGSLKIEDPANPDGTQYGYGIARMHWSSNEYYYHGGETPGYNSFIGFDTTNKVSLVVWTNLTVSPKQELTANTLMLKVLEHIYVVSPIPAK